MRHNGTRLMVVFASLLLMIGGSNEGRAQPGAGRKLLAAPEGYGRPIASEYARETPLPEEYFRAFLSGDLLVRARVESIEYECYEKGEGKYAVLESEAVAMVRIVKIYWGAIVDDVIPVRLLRVPYVGCLDWDNVDGPSRIEVGAQYLLAATYISARSEFVANCARLMCIGGRGEIERCQQRGGFDNYGPERALRRYLAEIQFDTQASEAADVIHVRVLEHLGKRRGASMVRVEVLGAVGGEALAEPVEVSLYNPQFRFSAEPIVSDGEDYLFFVDVDAHGSFVLHRNQLSVVPMRDGVAICAGTGAVLRMSDTILMGVQR